MYFEKAAFFRRGFGFKNSNFIDGNERQVNRADDIPALMWLADEYDFIALLKHVLVAENASVFTFLPAFW